MKPLYFAILLISLIVYPSCATLINSETQKVFINQDSTLNLQIKNEYTYNKSYPEAFVPLEHKQDYYYFQRSSIPITLIDSIGEDTLIINPHKSYFLYWFGNIYATLGLGMLVDKDSHKKFQYQKYNYIIKENSTVKNVRFSPIKENKVKITLGIPYVNSFHLETDSSMISTTGFWGISLGIEYFLKKNQYLSASINLASDFFVPVPAAVDFWGEWESSSTIYGNLRYNKSTPYIEYGAGIAFSYLSWGTRHSGGYDSTYVFVPRSHSSFNIGISSSFQYRLSPRFKVGYLYQPYLYRFNNGMKYQHFMTLEFILRL